MGRRGPLSTFWPWVRLHMGGWFSSWRDWLLDRAALDGGEPCSAWRACICASGSKRGQNHSGAGRV